ncbi:5-formyltetrahydrofolate cyclo-ligase [Anaplasma bovis]|uniref:5-formyltetrahydrofolate cyclo-ligase n=1 Tax=Anaplasma bovis TaxID=186733 RepID=UPI002FF0BE53
MNLDEEKVRLRKCYRSLRKELHSTFREEASARLLENCIRTLSFDVGTVVSGYIPIDGEINILSLMQYIKLMGCTVVAPVVVPDSRVLLFKEWHNDSTLGVEARTPELLLVPLIAFDDQLHRLGFGGGYYDSTICFLKKSNPLLLCVGIAYDIQRCDKVPVSSHDQGLDLVITEKHVYNPVR